MVLDNTIFLLSLEDPPSQSSNFPERASPQSAVPSSPKNGTPGIWDFAHQISGPGSYANAYFRGEIKIVRGEQKSEGAGMKLDPRGAERPSL